MVNVSHTLAPHQLLIQCSGPPLHLVALRGSENLRGRAEGRVGEPGPYVETQGTGSVPEGSLEEVACEPSLGGMPMLPAQRDGKEGILGRRKRAEACVVVGTCWV